MSDNAKRWLVGLAGATISGAAGGLTAIAVGCTMRQIVALVVIPGVVSLGKYLQMNPLPAVQLNLKKDGEL